MTPPNDPNASAPHDAPRPATEPWTWQRPADGRAVFGADEGAHAPSLSEPVVAPTPPPAPVAALPQHTMPTHAPPSHPPPSYPPPGYAAPGYGAPVPPGYPAPSWGYPQPPAGAPPRSPKVKAALIAGTIGVLMGFATNLIVCLLPLAMIAGGATVVLATQARAEALRDGRDEELAPWLMLLGAMVAIVPLLMAALAMIMVLFFQELMVKMLSGAGG